MHFCTLLRLYSKKNLVYGTYAGVDYNSLYLIVSYPPPLKYKGKGVEWERFLLLVEHICICLLTSKTGFLCKKYKEGGGKG
jgi:hypothetical protein